MIIPDDAPYLGGNRFVCHSPQPERCSGENRPKAGNRSRWSRPTPTATDQPRSQEPWLEWCELFGVANVEEAGELNDLDRDILLLSPSAPGERREVVARRCIATVSSAQEAAEFRGRAG